MSTKLDFQGMILVILDNHLFMLVLIVGQSKPCKAHLLPFALGDIRYKNKEKKKALSGTTTINQLPMIHEAKEVENTAFYYHLKGLF